MYPGNFNDWLADKSEPIDEVPKTGSVARAWQWRERGINPPNQPPNKTVLENIAEDILVQKPLQITSCDLPGYPRSTFLMVFSPDGTKLASTHGNHNIYVSELASGKHVRILKGHPRTPWCIAFHPSHPQLIGSGCLGGQVRVWDIASGGSEVWNVRNETVIASIAFHPREQLLVIATYNELYFWDWSKPAPFSKVSTNNINEKVRYVAFDSLGFKLITGISLSACASNANSSPLATQNPPTPANPNSNARSDGNDDPPGRPADTPGTAQDMIVNSYQTLVQRYDSLVRNYQRLFMVRHRLINTPLANTIDRGTDPMESFPPESGRHSRRFTRRISRPTPRNDSDEPIPGPSRQPESSGGGDAPAPTTPQGAALLMAEQLAIDPEAVRSNDTPEPGVPVFRSIASAFHPLGDERTTRLLPNPFSSTNGSSRQPDSSRTSGIFRGSESALSALRQFSIRRRNLDEAETAARNLNTSEELDVNRDPPPAPAPYTAPPLPSEPPPSRPPPPPEPAPSTSTEPSTSARTTSNSGTQINPDGDAHTINESLDLIRDILRDSGTRLLNLITNMSMNILTNSNPDEGARDARARLRVFTGTLRREFLASDSESEGDNAHPEVNILRTPNSTFREGNSETTDANRSQNASAPTTRMTFDLNESPMEGPSRAGSINISDRMTFEPNETENEGPSREGGINVSVSSGRFRVRMQGEDAADMPGPPNPAPAPAAAPITAPSPAASSSSTPADEPQPGPSTAPDFDPNEPSTSRDSFWSENPDMQPAEAYRRVRLGVAALQKHTLQLANMWLRGDRTSLRDLRTMWEDLRRRIITLNNNRHNRTEARGFYTRSLLERCMILTEMTEITEHFTTRQLGRRSAIRRHLRRGENAADSNNSNNDSNNATTDNATAEPSTSAENNESRGTRPGRGSRNGPQSSQRKRLQPSYRWRPDEELRRRARHSTVYRISQLRNRNRGELARSVEMNATRHVIRTRAMKVLSIMFNMMMMCIDERGLSQLIINMLKTLKKALALTCFMMMSNRIVPRTSNGSTPAAPNVDSADVVRIQNVEHPGPVNVDGPDDPASPRVAAPAPTDAPEDTTTNGTDPKPTAFVKPSTSQASTSQSITQRKSPEAAVLTTSQTSTPVDELPSPSPNSSAVGAWSHRLAVQISAANRNNSVTAKTRREMYLEARRQKALHRTNPVAHPFIRRRFPPVAAHRIPALRSLPPGRGAVPRMSQRSPEPPNSEPVAGPSNASNRYDGVVGFQIGNRENVLRLAHLRLRTAARNRFRIRTQTFSLSPSSVREMFALQDLHSDNLPSVNNSPEENGPRAFGPQPGPSREPSRVREFHAMLASEGLLQLPLPLMHVNELSAGNEGQAGQAQRLPRIHEYLQPIILAQNAMVVDEDEGGGPPGPGGPRRFSGMAGLLDAGIISEALPAPSHRVQAWDFTTGAAPDIADNTKNVVVQRCRIHNDASIDISKDGRLLVALLPVPRFRNSNNWLGVYSLEWPRLGQCLHTAVLEQSAVSVALSPTARYLAVGLGSRRFSSSHSQTNIIALLYKLDPLESSSRTGLSPMKELEQYWEHGFTSLNCLRWAPQPGQGLVYANNTGQLIIMR